jgi:arsenite methyltransferase
MAVPSPLPPDELRAAVGQRYGQVASFPEKPVGFPVGRGFAEAVGYTASLLDRLPSTASASFAGVAGLERWLRLAEGASVVDLGCGAGLDTLIAARQVGEEGHVTGIDCSPEMTRVHG